MKDNIIIENISLAKLMETAVANKPVITDRDGKEYWINEINLNGNIHRGCSKYFMVGMADIDVELYSASEKNERKSHTVGSFQMLESYDTYNCALIKSSIDDDKYDLLVHCKSVTYN